MQVIHLSAECYPVAKVGGLADVVGALPKYQRKLGVDASVVMPWFDKPYVQANDFEIVAGDGFYQGSQYLNYTIYKQAEDKLGFPLYLIKIPTLLDREEVYGYTDEADQWIAFQHAFLHWLVQSDIRPDIINCHDHHVGLTPFLLKHGVDFRELSSIKTVCTVHNGQYQGWMNWNRGVLLPKFDTWKWGLLDWGGVINPLATAIKCADAYSTVSEGYLLELYEDANGLQDLFRKESWKAYGIVNGIDLDVWNPSTDPLINNTFTLRTIKSGKRKNKAAFCAKLGISTEGLLLTYIGRFAYEKGADYLSSILENFNSFGEKKLTIFILGSGDKNIQADIERTYSQYTGDVAVYFGYNEALAHEAYAASDLLLMPSRVEPCGLNQLYALKYGTIPIVRGIGGLKDTVIDVNEDEGYGFVFDELNIDHIIASITRAINFASKDKDWSRITKKAMSLDFSWDKSAQKYLDLYNLLLK